MTTRVVARAPGKLFLLGEYAVLDGCPAVVAAVDRRVEVSLELGSPGTTARIHSALGSAEFCTTASPVETGPLQFASVALHSALAVFPQLGQRNAVIRIASDIDTGQRAKLGLGSSAATTAAIVAAVFAAAGHDLSAESCRHLVFAAALDAHRRVQRNVGSGADIAASVYGGVVLLRPAKGTPQVTPLAVPAPVRLLAAWTGESASTPELVQQYLAARNGSGAIRAAFVEASRAAVAEFVRELARGSLSLSAVLASGGLLEQLATDLHLPLLTPRLRQLVTLARAEGAAAKISGAGGGDCGIALTEDEFTARRVRAAWEAAGLQPLNISICHQGVHVDPA